MEFAIKVLAGLAGTSLVYYLIAKARPHSSAKEANGNLYFGRFIIAVSVGISLTAIAPLLVLLSMDLGDDPRRFAVHATAVMFAPLALSSWAEFFYTKGYFDSEQLTFQSIWRGKRHYKLSDLETVDFSENFQWYVLRFREGKPVRLSVFLHGQEAFLNQLADLGHDF